MDSQISWNSLRKQARKLEAQLDEQMSFYCRLVATKADGSESDLESGLEQLLKELHLQMDTVISQAQATLGPLVLQRSTFSGISSKITNISSRLPSVNHILSAIKRKKSMDTTILSLVASVCTFLILIYWLTK